MASTSRRTKTAPNVNITSISSQASLLAETIANNDDLLTQILVWLPIKSLLKFKCVSKHWLSIISDPDFSIRLSLNPKSISGLFLRRFSLGLTNYRYEFISLHSNPSAPPFRSLTFADEPSDILILQSCNGLLLCCCSCTNQHTPNYYVYNPTTKQHTVLPPFSSTFSTIFHVCLAFDPSKSPHYKVICLRSCNTSTEHYQIEIYSSKTGPWRVSGAPFTMPFEIQLKDPVFWNGGVHWIGDWGDSLSFDVDEERMRVMPMPPIPDEWDKRMYRYFGESRGHLHLIEVYGSCIWQFSVYEMERDLSGWFPKFHIDLDPIATTFPEMVTSDLNLAYMDYDAFSVLCLVREEIDEDSYLVLHIPNKAIRYNFKDKTFKKICDLAPSHIGLQYENLVEFGYYDVFQYIESFTCV